MINLSRSTFQVPQSKCLNSAVDLVPREQLCAAGSGFEGGTSLLSPPASTTLRPSSEPFILRSSRGAQYVCARCYGDRMKAHRMVIAGISVPAVILDIPESDRLPPAYRASRVKSTTRAHCRGVQYSRRTASISEQEVGA